MNLRAMLERDEGREHSAYPDSRGFWTIGIGHKSADVHKGLTWTDAQIDAAFDLDVTRAVEGCKHSFPWFGKLNDARQAVLVGMCFQMGLAGLLKFHDTLHAISLGSYGMAAEMMKRSLWARQTPLRCLRMAEQLASGDWVAA